MAGRRLPERPERPERSSRPGRSGVARRGPSQGLAGEAGSGSLLAVGVIASVFALTMMLIPVTQALAVKQRLAAAADAAALAAADTASGAITGFPCEAADAVARLHEAALGECALDGIVATVSVHATYLGFEIEVRARAGPPGTTPQRSGSAGSP